jgi:hydrogenase maturation protein HypF
MVDRGFNTPLTSSAGRLFDAIAALLGVRDTVTYEGQAAIELEQLARRGNARRGPSQRVDVVEREGKLILDPEQLFDTLLQAVLERTDIAHLAAGFHSALAEALAVACSRVREGGGPSLAVLCGGVFQNRILTRLTAQALKAAGFEVVLPGLVPVNDGGIALGQIMVAASAENAYQEVE